MSTTPKPPISPPWFPHTETPSVGRRIEICLTSGERLTDAHFERGRWFHAGKLVAHDRPRSTGGPAGAVYAWQYMPTTKRQRVAAMRRNLPELPPVAILLAKVAVFTFLIGTAVAAFGYPKAWGTTSGIALALLMSAGALCIIHAERDK